MAKSLEQNTTRKPPEPSSSHAEIEDWMRRVMPDLQPIVEHLDELIRKTIPGLQRGRWGETPTARHTVDTSNAAIM